MSGSRELKERLRTARGRPLASQRWLTRQINDPYVHEARKQGYRSRAAFKLIQLDQRFHLLKPGLRVLDLGAAPGGWAQVAAHRVGSSGAVVAVDILAMAPIPNVAILELDFLAADAERMVLAALGGPVDLVLSDMAPPATGHKQTDHLRIMALCEAAADFATRVLAPGGGFVCKVWQGGTESSLLGGLKRRFAQVRHAKPEASRKESAETYLVATGFKG
ncbi:RlmE family RNA methyltransferase [Desertibaculum subflavum]|uniref:RlmE family RNA methyltransferase n=1 Tax=Desertibaculum subflavum TaxID=2268458 RepID=UPI000E668668